MPTFPTFEVSITSNHFPEYCSSKLTSYLYPSVQFSSLKSLSHVWICDPRDCSKPGFPVHHQLLELTQTHAHWVSDAIQPSHPLLSPSPLAFNLPQHQFFASGGQSIGSFIFNISPSIEFSGLISFRMDWISLQSKNSQESSPTPQFKSINSSELSFLYSPTLTTTHNYWKNHSFD